METCQSCGRQYHTVYRVPDEVWAVISPKPVEGNGGGGLLCPACCEMRARAAGITLFWEAAVNEFPTLLKGAT